MKKKLFYIFSLVILIVFLGISFYTGVKYENNKVTKPEFQYIIGEITEEDLLEAIRLRLDFGWHHYYGWEERAYKGMNIICHNGDKIAYSINLEQDDESKKYDDRYFTDYSNLYMVLVKRGNYYFGDYFAGDDLANDSLIMEEYCEKN